MTTSIRVGKDDGGNDLDTAVYELGDDIIGWNDGVIAIHAAVEWMTVDDRGLGHERGARFGRVGCMGTKCWRTPSLTLRDVDQIQEM